MPEAQKTQTQAQTQEVQAQVQETQAEILIHPISTEIAADFLVVPGLQAYFDSPRWRPIVLRDKIVYIWPDDDVAEALLVPSRPVFRLFYITRTSRKPLLFLVEPGIPGGRATNLFKEPLVFDNYYVNEFIAAFVYFQGDLKKIAYCGRGGHGICITCKRDIYFDICFDETTLKVTVTPLEQP